MPKKQKVNREHLVQMLEFVKAGLANREIIDQSSCFVFKGGEVMTYNQELACRVECPLKMEGAVQAAPLLALLLRIPEETVRISMDSSHFRVYGKRRKAGIRMEEEVLLPIDDVQKPKKWKPLAPEFNEAVKIAAQCVGNDESMFVTTCIHIHPKWVEASDSYQITRYKMDTGFSEPAIIRGETIKKVADMGVTEFSETSHWIHFRNDSQLVMSCKRHLEDFIDLGPHLKMKGAESLVLPRGLAEACETAGIFSSDSSEENLVTVHLEEGLLRVEGRGIQGWYEEEKRVNYDGTAFSFMVSPKILAEIVQRMNKCEITEEKLRVLGEKWVYISCLTKAGTEEEEEEEEGVEEEEGEE